ncbi:hypothetical protein HHI36_013708 [Cryptolaemus montrouzieri]|uniref:Major facilitator superfamily (MFS) profile domain-containing protein n=1 Tax=Cryptolaemus montrouzieri TaxID=559131 RepID=A0ABD2NII7_9CUCU
MNIENTAKQENPRESPELEEPKPKNPPKIQENIRSEPTEAPIRVTDQPENEPKIICTFSQLFTATAVSLLSLVIGYATAYSSPSDASLRKEFYLGNSEMSLIGGLMPLSAVFGVLMGGFLIEYCGRKGTMFVIDITFLISWLIIYYSSNLYQLYVSRCLVGGGIGVATLALPVYLVETIQPEVRGILGLLPMTFGNIGIFVCFVYGIFVNWRNLALIGLVLTLPFLIFFIWIIPETPAWYIAHDKLGKCKKALVWLRGENQDVTKELNDLIRKNNEQKSRETNISLLFKTPNLKPLIIVLGLMFFQQFSGINAVIFYTTSIFRASGSNMSASICTTIIGAVNLISSFIANGLIDRLGRRVLLQLSSILMTLGLGCLGFYYYVKEILLIDVSEYGFLPLTNLIIFVAGFSIGFGPIPWLMMGELVPVEVKSIVVSIVTSINWACTFVITLTFLCVAQMFGYFAIFWFFCCMVLTGGVLTWLVVPETRGTGISDIARPRSRFLRSTAHSKPFPSTNM